MKVNVNKDNCIGCGYCEGVCDQVFAVEDGYSHVISETVPEECIDNVQDAIENCPTNAIEEINE